MKREKGIIVSLVRPKGIGFILKEDGSTIFFHVSALVKPAYEDLKEGFDCEFLEVESKNGPKAIGIVAHAPM